MIRRAIWGGLFVPLLAMTLALATTGDARAAQWGMAQHDAQHTGKGLATGPSTALLKWSLQHPRGGWNPSFIAGTAIGDDGTIYAAGGDGRAYALWPDGTVKHTFDNVGVCCSSPAIGPDGTIYFSGTALYALNPDFTLKWVYPNGGACCGALVIGPDGTIYVVNGALHAVNPMDGTAKWVFQAPGNSYVPAAPALSPDGSTVYVATTIALYALDPVNAHVRWQNAISNIAETAPVVGADGTIYIPSTAALLALNPYGMTIRQIPVPAGKQVTSIAIDSGPQGETLVCTVFAYSLNPNYYFPNWASDGELYAIDPHAWTPAGMLRWTRPFVGGLGVTSMPDSKPIIDGRGAIYLAALVFNAPGSERGVHLYGFSASGSQLFDAYAPTMLPSDTRVLSMDNTGAIYVLTDGAVKAFSPPADRTPPTTYAGGYATAGNYGWYTSDMKISMWADDYPGGSGVAKTEYSYDGMNWYLYTAPLTVSSAGFTTIYYRSTDNAGNVEQPTQSLSFMIDKSAPYTYAFLNGTTGQNGWYTAAAQVSFSGADNGDGSGLAWTEYSFDGNVWNSNLAPFTITNQGATTVYYRSTDYAGNRETDNSLTVKVDSLPPVISGSVTPLPNGNGWNNTAARVHFAATDSGSGVNSVTSDAVLVGEGADQKTTGTAFDRAGNSAATIVMANIDKTPPVITGGVTAPPNAYGWYKGTVTVRFTATDGLSGVSTVTPDALLSVEGVSQSATGIAVDKAGNSATADVAGINIDQTAPVISITGIQDGAVYILGSVPVAGYTATDVLSGIASQHASLAEPGPAGVGKFTYTVAVTDQAGNVATRNVSYTVAYAFGGFLAPVSLAKPFKLGSTIPVKFGLADAGGASIAGATAKISLQKFSGATPAGDPLEVTSAGGANTGNLFRYDPVDNQYIFNLDTKGLSAGTWQIIITLDDQTMKTVLVTIK
jgi:hypothetical protein